MRSVLRCKCLHWASHPTRRGWCVPSCQDCAQTSPATCAKLGNYSLLICFGQFLPIVILFSDWVQVLLRPRAPLRAALPPQGAAQVVPRPPHTELDSTENLHKPILERIIHHYFPRPLYISRKPHQSSQFYLKLSCKILEVEGDTKSFVLA